MDCRPRVIEVHVGGCRGVMPGWLNGVPPDQDYVFEDRRIIRSSALAGP